MAKQQFDVFLCHNSEDKTAVIQIAQQLQTNGLKPWLDAWEIRPGGIWQFELEQQIRSIGSAAVFVGQNGIGPWQSEEIYAFLQAFIRRGCPVIPVLLPDIPTRPELPIFLESRNWVDFRLQDPDPLAQLIWGVTGEKPGSSQQIKPEIAKTTLIDLDSALASSKLDHLPRLHDSQRLKDLQQRAVTAIESSKIIQGKSLESKSVEDDLASDKGIDYTRLRDLLKAGKWQEADQETCLRMLEAIGRKNGNWFYNKDEFLSFPCTDLKTIDHLWVRYSNNQFGFSVQKEIYDQCFTKSRVNFPGDVERIWEEFCDQVGWRVHTSYTSYILYPNTVTFSISAPRGHLPANGFGIEGEVFSGRSMELRDGLFSRLQACEA